MIRACDFHLDLNVLKLDAGVIITTVVSLVSALDKPIQCQRLVPATLMAAMPDVMIRRPLLKLTVLGTNYRDVAYSGYVQNFRVVVAVAVHCASTSDEICCSYAFGHYYKLHTMAGPDQ